MSAIEELAGEFGQGWFGTLFGESTPGGLPLNSTSAAFEVVRVVKSGAGLCFGFTGFSNAGSLQYVQVFDAQPQNTATGLTNGAIPKAVVAVPATSNFSVDWSTWGRAFSQGIIIACSSTAATLTLGTATIWVDAQYV